MTSHSKYDIIGDGGEVQQEVSMTPEKGLSVEEGGHNYTIKKSDDVYFCKCGCWYHLAYGCNPPEGEKIDPHGRCPKNPINKKLDSIKKTDGEHKDQP